jgi:hypothetical protein
MDFETYTHHLNALRDEYVASIKGYAETLDDVTLIYRAESEAAEYRFRVQQLIEEYQNSKQVSA